MGRSLLRAQVLDDRSVYTDDTRTVFWEQRLNAMRVVLDRAAERGELRPGVDIVGAVQLLIAPLNARALYSPGPVDDRYCGIIADLTWHAIAQR